MTIQQCIINARGSVRNQKSNRICCMCCSHKPECIATTKPTRQIGLNHDYNMTILNVSVIHLIGESGAWSENRFGCSIHCYVTWCFGVLRCVWIQFYRNKPYLQRICLLKLRCWFWHRWLLKSPIAECLFTMAYNLGSSVFYKSLYWTCFQREPYIAMWMHFHSTLKVSSTYLQENPIALHQGRYTWIYIRWNLQVGAECTRLIVVLKYYSKRTLSMDM